MDKYYVFLVVLAFPSICEALTFISSPDATTTACDGKNVTFNWNYTSGTTSTITWTKRNNDATNTRNATVATFSLGLFDPGAAYTSRVTQVGNNAAIQFSGVTPADDGIYQVEIFDGSSTLKGNTTLTTFDSPVGTITVSYLRITGVVKCDGLSYLGSGSLTLVLDGNIAMSTQSLSLEFTPIIRGRYCCCVNVSSDFDKCLPPGVNCSAECVDVEATTTAPSQPTETTFPISSPTTTRNNTNDLVSCDECEVALIAVVILVVLLVMEIVTYVIFVGYRWGDKFGTKYMQICEQIITNEKREHILYWICFILGIICIICGVTFFIVICVVCTECLEEGLPIAALVIGIIVVITGTIILVMCLCCCCCHKKPGKPAKPDDPCSWFCCCCHKKPGKPAKPDDPCSWCCCCCHKKPGKNAKPDDPCSWCCCCCLPNIIYPRRKRKQRVHSTTPRTLPSPTSASDSAPSPSSHPPMPSNMASPRKPPAPLSSTTLRALPSPTSDPASDSAVNPSVHLEPLSVEEPKKKKKKRKKRKKINEAGGETSDQPMNPAGDSDE